MLYYIGVAYRNGPQDANVSHAWNTSATIPVQYSKMLLNSELVNHVTVLNMPNNEWKCVHQRQDEERVCDPPVKDLELLMCNSGHQCDPIRLSCSRTTPND